MTKEQDFSKEKRKSVKFQVEAESGSRVYLAGSFNDWNPEQKQLKERKGLFSTTLKLPTGRYEYKFVVDGTWRVDPQCEEWVPNGLGSINSVVAVEEN